MSDDLETMIQRLQAEGLEREAEAIKLVKDIYVSIVSINSRQRAGELEYSLNDLLFLVRELDHEGGPLDDFAKQELMLAIEQVQRVMDAESAAFATLLEHSVTAGLLAVPALLAVQGYVLPLPEVANMRGQYWGGMQRTFTSGPQKVLMDDGIERWVQLDQEARVDIFFRGDPDLQRAFYQQSLSRFDHYWGIEKRRFSEGVQKTLLAGLERGVGVKQMARDLQKEVGMSRNRALLIASNEMGNAAAYAAEHAAKEMGVTHYRWKTCRDRRVRDIHRARNNRVYAWAEPPSDGHPGQPIRCRCLAAPWPPDRPVPVVGKHRSVGADSAKHDPSNEVTTPIINLPLPKKRTYIDGPTDERMERILDKLQSDYPSPRKPAHKLCYQEEDWQEAKRLIRMRPEEGAAAVYVRSANIIAISYKVTRLLDSRDARERLAGTRYLIHEWFHAMRTDDHRIYPLEEGGAELFADRITRQLTGIDGSLRRIQPYAGFAKGVVLLGEARLGANRALYWARQSRDADNMQEWLRAEMSALGMKDADITLILDYNEASRGSWLRFIKQALERTQ